METIHQIIVGNSNKMESVNDESVDLIVTSPPYPMIAMWDDMFKSQDDYIDIENNPLGSFIMMHSILDKTWLECYRVLKPGGFMCVNVGDATRTVNGQFRLYDNHTQISYYCTMLGLTMLPSIIWRKPTNAPNKFMGSGTLPCGAYVTLEHEWILIFRKGDKRAFKTDGEKGLRAESSYFWEERNIWFSDLWRLNGIRQVVGRAGMRHVGAIYPFEIPYRLINMYSLKGDLVLDPFLGTGTTIKAAMACGRNSIGYEIDGSFASMASETINDKFVKDCNRIINNRISAHNSFVLERESEGKSLKYFNENIQMKVMTKPETKMKFDFIDGVIKDNDVYRVFYC